MRTPKRVDDAATVERVVKIPGWLYNLLIDRAQSENRDVKRQLETEMERMGKEWQKQAAAR